MSLEIKLTNANLISYARTEDAHEAFVNSVNNGQTRLALEVLAELIDGIMEVLDGLVSSDSDEPKSDIQVVNVNAEPETVVEPTVATPAEPDKSKATKTKADKEAPVEV